MPRSPHLLAAISGHGFGHLAQAGAVVQALHARLPGLRLSVRSAIDPSVLERRIGISFVHQRAADDLGMLQTSALDVDAAASAAAYARFHRDWEERVERTAAALAAAGPDLVLADIPYLTLAAAERVGIPAVALCSLNWLDIYRHYCGDRPEAPAILETMAAAYASAKTFLRPAPSMPMPDLPNTRAIGPVAVPGRNRRAELDERLALPRGERLVLVAMGGLETGLPVHHWPAIPGVRWVAADLGRTDGIALEGLAMPFTDVLASCDLVITKPGYGIFVEAAAAGVPVAYVLRGDWPEEPCLVEWLAGRGGCVRLHRSDYEAGRVEAVIGRLLDAGPLPPVPPAGATDAAACLLRDLPAPPAD